MVVSIFKHNGCISILKPKEYTAVVTPSNTGKINTMLNRVAGGFSPSAPTPPIMRIRNGRFENDESTKTNGGFRLRLGMALDADPHHFSSRRVHCGQVGHPHSLIILVQAFAVSQPLRWAFDYSALTPVSPYLLHPCSRMPSAEIAKDGVNAENAGAIFCLLFNHHCHY